MLQKEFHENHFESIQALRGIAALFVLFEHIRFINCGAFGVDIFFIISGFMILFSTHKSSRFFLRKRLIRILPLYYLMTVGTFILLLLFPGIFAFTQAKPAYLLKSLLFIPFEIQPGVIQPLMRIGWTVNYEMFFYLLFFLAMRISHKYRGLLCSVFLIALVTLGNGLGIGALHPALAFYTDPILLEFAMGMLSYYIAMLLYGVFQQMAASLVDSGNNSTTEKTGFSSNSGTLVQKRLPLHITLPLIIVALSGIVLLFTYLVTTKHTINILGFRRLPLWGIPAMVIVLCTFIIGLCMPAPSVLCKLGNISFSLYLIHYYPVQFLDRFVFDFGTVTAKSVIGAILTAILCIVLGWICWWVVEKKGTGWLKKCIKLI